MPATLAIETSTAHGGVAVVHEGVVQYEDSFVSERSHNAQLFAPLAEALKLCGTDLGRIVVGLGPGSYTGARIGIAAAQGIALSRNVPVFGLPSVLAPDWAGLPESFTVCGDARRAMFYMAQVQNGSLAGEITLHSATELAQLRDADAHGSWFTFDAKPLPVCDVLVTTPSAPRLALLASTLTAEAVETLQQEPLEPRYLAAPFVTKGRTPFASRASSSS